MAEAQAVAATATADRVPVPHVPEHWFPLNVKVSKKVETGKINADGTKESKYEEVGEVTVPIPLLIAFGINAKIAEHDEDTKLPIYEDDRLEIAFQAIVAAQKADARNMLVSGTAILKDGKKIASTFEEILADPARGPHSAEAIKLWNECCRAFNSYVQSLNKTAAAYQTITQLFRKRDALSIVGNDMKKKILGYVEGFATSLSEADLTRYMKVLTAVNEAGKQTADVNDI